MDLDPSTTGFLPNTIGTYIEWTVENLEGSKWNSFNIVGSNTVSSWGFDIIGYYNLDDITNIQVTILNVIDQRVVFRTKPQISVSVALAGFRRYRWEVTDTGSTTTTLGSVHMAYCKPTGSMCPSIGNYPSVGEGQISLSSCPEGYSGYSYRECSGGVLGEINTDHCICVPSSLNYNQTVYIIPSNTYFITIPTCQGDDLSFSITSGSLPIGLSLNSITGMISGSPSQSVSSRSVTIKAFNQVSDQSFSLSFTIQLIPSSLNYNQTIFIIQNNTYFITNPTCEGDDLSFSIISGSLPIGISIHSSTGIISGTPLSSIPLTNITIQASNQVGSTQFTISILVTIPLSNLHYSQFSFTLIKGQSFSISPIISGDNPVFTITSGTLPPGLSLNQSTGIISGIPSESSPSTVVIIRDSFKLNYPLLSMLYPLSLSFSSLFLFLSFSFSLLFLSFERTLIYVCIGRIGLRSFQSHIQLSQIILFEPTNHPYQLIMLLLCYQIL
ncbi:hypothetical protein JH06_5695 [Blastocystis sp. subtype 4]|uniref:hypothetical protein n=1 Tax=Blastocystis sp. subtype 4 TaxID=944170 RepID=UPI000711702C|nr:hypothetical protein JH06_5695 [Blastocystis sp. subtype 4]KNB41317.1 hypothetical protein JH06_5695 [Blastocystis sp. subtype 4]|eukprot:XP_014524760.1 hypothetical protein JH06_5695 [Blastocystis sp. subtype 4]